MIKKHWILLNLTKNESWYWFSIHLTNKFQYKMGKVFSNYFFVHVSNKHQHKSYNFPTNKFVCLAFILVKTIICSDFFFFFKLIGSLMNQKTSNKNTKKYILIIQKLYVECILNIAIKLQFEYSNWICNFLLLTFLWFCIHFHLWLCFYS